MKLFSLMFYLLIATVLLNVVLSVYLSVQVGRLWEVARSQISLNEYLIESDTMLTQTDTMIVDLLKDFKEVIDSD